MQRIDLCDESQTKKLKTSVNPDTPSSLASLTQQLMDCLTGSTEYPLTLTDKMLHLIHHDLADVDFMSTFLQLIQQLQPLTQAKVDILFLDPVALLEIHLILEQTPEHDECFSYLFDRIQPKTRLSEIAKELSQHQAETWLTTTLFRAIVDHQQQFYGVISGFKSMHDLGILATHHEKFLANIPTYYSFYTLQFCNMLTAENAILALDNPDFSSARDMCDQATYKICHHQGLFKNSAEIHQFHDTLLRNPPLASALITFDRIRVKRFAEKNPLSQQECQASVKYILGFENPSTTLTSGLTLFTAPRQPILEKRLQRLKERYGDAETVVKPMRPQ